MKSDIHAMKAHQYTFIKDITIMGHAFTHNPNINYANLSMSIA